MKEVCWLLPDTNLLTEPAMLILVVLMLTMLGASILFCHALEHLGRYLNLSMGFTASVLIAIGTATPELLVPVVAIGTNHSGVGVGAVLGSSLMLLTIAFPLCGIFALYKRGKDDLVAPEVRGADLDLKFICYGILILIIVNITQYYFVNKLLNYLFVLLMILCYLCYLYQGFKLSKQQCNNSAELQKKKNIVLILLQLLIAFIMMFYSTEYLIQDIEHIASSYGVSAFLLSMIITPVITELPEKVNSISYILKKKDTLAIGNITGALVLQTILLPALPTMYALWTGENHTVINLLCIGISYIWLLLWFKRQRYWKIWQLIPPIILYLVNIYFCFLI